jgi:hypothetical protein
VVEDSGEIVAGFEVTEVECGGMGGEVRKHNTSLASKMAGEPPPTERTKNPETRQAMLDRADRVEEAHAIVAGDEKLEKIQQFVLRLSEEALAALIIERLEPLAGQLAGT